MNEESNNFKIDPELEVRIVALVMGEVSAFESERLLALMESNPELAAFKAQLESTHALLRDVATGEFPEIAQPWKLPDTRRQELLHKLDGNTRPEALASVVSLASHDSDKWKHHPKWNLKAIAAVISATAVIGMVAIFVASQSLLSSRQSSYGLARRLEDSANVDSALSAVPSFSSSPNNRPGGATSDGEADYVLSDLGESAGVDGFGAYRSAESEVVEGFGNPASTPDLKANITAVPDDVTTWNFDAVPTEEMTDPARLYFDGSGLTEKLAERSAGRKMTEARVEQGVDSPQPTPGPVALQLGVPTAEGRASSVAADRFEYRNRGGMRGSALGLEAIKRGESVSGAANPPASSPQILTPGEPVLRWSDSDGKGYGTQVQVGQGFGLLGDLENKKGLEVLPESKKKADPRNVTNLFSDLEPEESSPVEGKSMSAGTAMLPAKPEIEFGKNPAINKRLEDSVPLSRRQRGLDSIDKLAKSDAEETVSELSSLDLAKSERELLSRAADQDSLVRKTAASLDEKETKTEAFSTFSLHVSDVSFKLAMAALAKGEWPEAAKIRIEEFVNAFDYGDPLPSDPERVACRIEQSIHPFLQQRNLLRVSMRTAATGRATNTPLRLTFLLDNSGSMERFDRQQTVRRAFALLASQLQPSDQVTLISFARQPRLLADKVNGAQASELLQVVEKLPSEGGTNIEAALQLAFEKAREQHIDGAQNRIVLLTDGAVNLGNANPESLSNLITTIREAGIAFDAAGISAEGLNDEVLEALARKGDGRYYLLDSLEACDDGFARQIAGALRPSAKNVKVQVEFNPKRVGRYKLLGFEKHLLKQEDFRNDQVDAAEMAAAEAGVAVYQFEANPNGEGDVGLVSVRFRDLETGEMVENRWPIPYTADPPRPDQATPSMRIATCASLFAAKLRGDALGESVELTALAQLLSSLPQPDLGATRVQQLQQMIEQARQMK